MTDQELVELFWQRREEALTGLQDKYGGWCRSIAGRILGEERDVEECLGDCWLQLWNAIPPARPQHFRGYLGAVVRNRARRRLREVCRLSGGNLKSGYDLVVVARSRALSAPFSQLLSHFEGVCRSLKLWRDGI